MARHWWSLYPFVAVTLVEAALLNAARGADLIPPFSAMKTDRPRVLLRPSTSPYAISLAQLRAIPRDTTFKQLLGQLRAQRNAAAQAMVWLLEKDAAAAEAALARMRAYTFPGRVDTFHMYFRLMEFGLAYDWLYAYEGFTDQIKADVRARVTPLAERAIAVANDHMFHNYIWMSAGGLALWTLATAGEDPAATKLFERTRRRFNRGLYPAWRYLDGLPSEPMGYWALYVLSPGVLALLGAQSAFETDCTGRVRRDENGWLGRHFDNLIHSTLPNLRYIPWGDLQGGPNGGVTHEMAGVIDALTWSLNSPHGVSFSRRIASKRGVRRFHGETAVFFMLYSNHLKAEPAEPPLSFMAGDEHSGHMIARSGWDDGATIVSFTCTDHFGDHHHYDQGSFVIYRNGLLAVDPPVYRRIRGPQQKTENHNTLLLGGRAQRPVRGQWFVTIEEFKKNLTGGRKLETGDIRFFTDAGAWAAVAGQFAQAYAPDLVQSCVRQLLFLRPGTVLVVDHLEPLQGRELPAVTWLLHVPKEPSINGTTALSSNGASWIRCRPILPGGSTPSVVRSDVGTHRLSYRYDGTRSSLLVHVLEVGDGRKPPGETAVTAQQNDGSLQITVDNTTFLFQARSPFHVSVR